MTPCRGKVRRNLQDSSLRRACTRRGQRALSHSSGGTFVEPPAAHPPIRVALTCGGKLAVAVVDQIRAITKERLRSRLGALREEETCAIGHALREILDLEPAAGST